MDDRRMSLGDLPEEAGWGSASSDVRTFQLGDVGLIDVVTVPARFGELQQALLWMWAVCPAGVLIRISVEGTLDKSTLRTITGAGELVRTWPGTPIGVVSHNAELRRLVAADPQGRHLSGGVSLAEAWQRMRAHGAAAIISLRLPSTLRASRMARQAAVRACLDWNLTSLTARASLITGDLVTRSVTQGAHDIHFSVSRQDSQLRILVRDDARSSAAVEPGTISDVFRARFTTPVLSDLSDSCGQFALDGQRISWAVVRDQPPARGSARAPELRATRHKHPRGTGSRTVRSTPG